MLPQHVLLALIATCTAVPLNINLGAYSPALVVGDGEISLGSTEKASELMATLASGAANGNGQQQGQQAQEQPPAEGQPAEGQAAKRAPNLVRTIEHFGKRDAAPAPAPEPVAEPAPLPLPAAAEQLDAVKGAMEWIKRDIQGFNAALSYAREALKDTPKIELGSPNAGVGIIVNPGLNVPANSAANGQPAAGEKAKRGEVVAEESETPKMTLVAITEV